MWLNGERSGVERGRCSSVFAPALVARSDREKLGVIPNVVVILGQKKAPTGRKTKVRKN